MSYVPLTSTHHTISTSNISKHLNKFKDSVDFYMRGSFITLNTNVISICHDTFMKLNTTHFNFISFHFVFVLYLHLNIKHMHDK